MICATCKHTWEDADKYTDKRVGIPISKLTTSEDDMEKELHISVPASVLRSWMDKLDDINPPNVTFSRDKLEMAHEAAGLCMSTASEIRDEINATLTPPHTS